MENRSRTLILDAAARVYAAHGFRGATTRRIAIEAGVNEVTLFRTFGSKEALIAEALRHHAATQPSAHLLPARPAEPERELTSWAEAQLAELRASRAMITKAMGEIEERPDLAPCVAAGWTAADHELRRYLLRLGELGFVNWAQVTADGPACLGGDPAPSAAASTDDPAPLGQSNAGTSGPLAEEAARRGDGAMDSALAAGAMLTAALFSDAMGREMMPELFPQPAERAPALYVRLFLRAIGCRGSAAVGTAAATPSGAVTTRTTP
jgi:AcrR family transcriptional regulator